ncbi:MAG: dihydropteroate synthase [Alphaproteobacteria bacterium]|nr:dihydropteroate synthase [Alphaproteobacteria bacterium]
MKRPALFGIVNVTEDSFSDGGRFLETAAALEHARALAAGGADVIDLGAAASNVDAKPVSAAEEIRRIGPLIAALKAGGTPVSVDSFLPEVQRFAIARDVEFLNDIQGFPDISLYPELAAAGCKLVVMHAVQGRGRAQRLNLSAGEVWDRVGAFFTGRIAALEGAGVALERIIIDPGMGFFLSSRPEASLAVLARLGELKRTFGVPVLVSVSRKSFLCAITGRSSAAGLGAATLAAELYAAEQGADYIRTHDPGALSDALRVAAVLRAAATRRHRHPSLSRNPRVKTGEGRVGEGV